ncbi:MAG: hypothetical protein ACYC64_17490 [Armatimonadota bacterium]
MKRYAILLAITMLLAMLAAGPSSAIFPKPDGSDIFSLFQGYYNDDLAWFVGFETNDIRLASSALFVDFIHAEDLFNNFAYHYPQFAPKLSSALVVNPVTDLAAARPMYVVRNFQQGAVLSTRPDNADYSGLWQLIFVDWLPGVTPRPITNDAAPGTDPQGLPSPAEATITPSNIVFSCPVIAIGRIGNPTGGNQLGSYLIPQAIQFSTFSSPNTPPKWVRLPTYRAWFENPITKATWSASSMPITDTSDPDLAVLLKANLAPGLLNMPDSDTQIFWTFLGPQPPSQRPIMSAGPSTSAATTPTRVLNQFLDYSPVMIYTELNRNIPISTVVPSKLLLELLLGNGGLTVADNDKRILGHVSFISTHR